MRLKNKMYEFLNFIDVSIYSSGVHFLSESLIVLERKVAFISLEVFRV